MNRKDSGTPAGDAPARGDDSLTLTAWTGDTAVIEIRRHERRNALNLQLCRDLKQEVETVATDARCIVITGQGTSFCAGADLDGVYGPEFIDALYSMLYTLCSVPVPVIAAVNGPAIGAGTQLAIACDIRICAPTARFAIPTARNGMAVDPWTIRRLRDLVGSGTAARIMLMAGTLDADEALARGLTESIGSLDEAMRAAQEICELAPLSLRYAKMVLNDDVLDNEADDAILQREFDRVWDSADVREGAQARAEQRRPRFTGN